MEHQMAAGRAHAAGAQRSRSAKRRASADDAHAKHLAAQSDVFQRARALAEKHEAEVMVVVVAKRGDVHTLSSPGMRGLVAPSVILPLLQGYGLLAPGTYVPPAALTSFLSSPPPPKFLLDLLAQQQRQQLLHGDAAPAPKPAEADAQHVQY
eukprot:m51a1_g4043 hypothetical protein (152) ;mRNA; r:686152-686715